MLTHGANKLKVESRNGSGQVRQARAVCSYRFRTCKSKVVLVVSMATMHTQGLSHHRLLQGHRRHQNLQIRSPAGAIPQLTELLLCGVTPITIAQCAAEG